ncbi:hypothetical protein BDM02DRAFT_3268494 [Thelephora ganbajun]|uniref:Uncharacterized protein n=1 Tax=Thelephora ganbajun TaxID=370292 RepID=A0ACB6ZK41_THEGA|nr:hypothetical protein BDM02DRAFT_3268494 [Thelephora ganbajun]
MSSSATVSSPVKSFGGKDDFDVSKTHVVQNMIPKDSGFTSGKHGAHSPIFSNDGTIVTWTEFTEDGCESGCAVLVASGPHLRPYGSLISGTGARVKVFIHPVPAPKPGSDKRLASPFKPTDDHTTSLTQPLPGGRPLYSQSSFTKPNDVHITRGLNQPHALVSQLTRFTKEESNGKSLDDGEEFYFDGAEMKIQGWVLKPKGYNKNNRKWAPLSLIHGGPQGVRDGWSTRWNLNAGYFVVIVSHLVQLPLDKTSQMPSGKVGEESRLSIPERDDNISSISIPGDRAVAAGADYGGYATKYFFALIPRDRDRNVPSWIQRNPGFGFGLKALVCHDGYNGYSADEHFFDYRLPEANDTAPFHALQQRGVPSRLVTFSDKNHRVLNHEHGLKWHYKVFHWLNQFAGKDNTNR